MESKSEAENKVYVDSFMSAEEEENATEEDLSERDKFNLAKETFDIEEAMNNFIIK